VVGVGGHRYAPGKTQYPLRTMLGGPQGRCGRMRKISPPPRFDDPLTVQPVATRYTYYVIPSHCQWEIQIYIWPKTLRITKGPLNFYFSGGDVCSLTEKRHCCHFRGINGCENTPQRYVVLALLIWYFPYMCITQADPSGRWLAGIVGSNPVGGMEVCLLWVLCVVR
jgi:hypothetical protein